MVCALVSAVCFGTASVLQAVAARAVETGSGSALDPVLLWRALHQWRYAAGLALDGLGFLLQIVALRSIPLYAVGAALAASLAVTAVVAAGLLGTRLTAVEWAAVVTVCGGLAMVALSSGPEGNRVVPQALRWSLLGAVAVVLLISAFAGRFPGGPRTLLWGVGAGAGFGVVEVAVRTIDSLAVPRVFADPALYALPLGGVVGFLLLTSALRGGSVAVATAGMVVAETAGPAVTGVIWLGDRPREGLAWLAVTGFAAAVAGALALARFGDTTDGDTTDGPEAPARKGRAGDAPGDGVRPRQPPQRQ
jgi:drug/metabolite transporter (DMT)-like permease